MRAELLTFEGCPHAEAARRTLRDVLADLAPEAQLVETRVEAQGDAERAGFLGSPSIRVDGHDLELRDGEPARLGCRLYGPDGAPPRWMVEAAVVRALKPRHLLFLCVANSARSQMAEGIARSLAPEGVWVSSAGSAPTRVRPEAVAALSEIGVDISDHTSTAASDVDPATVDAVVTLCAEEVCPTFLGQALRLRWGLPDPAAVAEPQARAQAFREVRDELQRRLRLLLAP